MKKKTVNPADLAARLAAYFRQQPARRTQVLVLVLSYVFLLAILVLFSPFSVLYARFNASRFESGRVADEDVIADREYSYVDEEGTRTRIEARLKLVLPVFQVNDAVTRTIMDDYADFRGFFLKDSAHEPSPDKLFLRLQTERPGAFTADEAKLIFNFPSRELLYSQTQRLLAQILKRGIVAFPKQGLEPFNPEYIEIWRWQGERQEREEIPVTSVLTVENFSRIIASEIGGAKAMTVSMKTDLILLNAFIRENAFFNADQSLKNLDQARKSVDPVVRKIVKGERIIRKGFIVTDADVQKVKAIGANSMKANSRPFFGLALYLLMLYILAFILLHRTVPAPGITPPFFYFFLGIGVLYLTLALLFFRFLQLPSNLTIGILLPTALVAMAVALMLGTRAAISFSLVISLATMLVTDQDVVCFLFSFLSAVAGTVVVKNIEKRIDLVKAGAVLAVVDFCLVIVLDLFKTYNALESLGAGFWASFNGFFCGIFTIGFMPMFEQMLNAPTRFRLIELSDLNSPVLKRLLTVAPGTYSHSVMVANLAESACKDIGANALLARVGSYYHDIGKIDSPEYFIENQTNYNKHDDLKPRLSATVIRSHVKIGVEKARQMRLPEAVIDIIAEHHGNGVISWFYNRAIEDAEGGEGAVNSDDFSYNGTPPRSREAAVVMLADTIEAATRTLKKPTLVKLEKFIDELVMDKINAGQLNEADLTLKDIEIVKKTFVKILAGHFHSRIEYPKPREAT
jgi:cyclic-di-AMP phosphodiesterase PgpH